ncbi:ABC transporter permease [Kribbella sp. VKM Ac-2568]|uniref:ABC transporter permease n=1 Tax=Kribbella sp. VKM Ac-2568 TaxID=2512219 RepID=UPI00104661F1|nr:ABC-2 family transporter protein [Kribbella sp. VKM Ac-2568]TCM45219.1 ABC-2 type transport system permease protein [Kribbella sp. VKM Ac-2568]
MRRFARLWWSCFVQAIRRDLQFRSQTIITAVSSTTELILGVIPVLILADVSATAVGWNGPLTLVVVGLYGACTGLMDCFVAPNVRRIDGYVRRGELDLILIRPVNAQLYATLRWMEPAELGRVVTGLGLAVAGAHAAHLSPSPGLLLVALLWMAIGFVGFSLLWANLAYLAFWVDSAEPVNEVAQQLREAGKYPLAYFPKTVQLILATIVPAGLIAAVPTGVLTGSTAAISLAILLLAAGFTLTVVHWRVAGRRYSSAS